MFKMYILLEISVHQKLHYTIIIIIEQCSTAVPTRI